MRKKRSTRFPVRQMLGLQFQCALSAPHLLLQLSKPTTIYKYLHTYYRTFLVKTYANQCTSHLFFMNYISRSSSYILFFFLYFLYHIRQQKKEEKTICIDAFLEHQVYTILPD